MNVLPYEDNQFSIFVKECDYIYHLGCNECLEFIDIWKPLHVLESKYCRRDSFSIEVNFLLKYENYAMKIFKLFSSLEYQGG